MRVRASRSASASALQILLLTGLLTVSYALGEGNVGTLYRHRAQAIAFYLMFAAVGLELAAPRSDSATRSPPDSMIRVLALVPYPVRPRARAALPHRAVGAARLRSDGRRGDVRALPRRPAGWTCCTSRGRRRGQGRDASLRGYVRRAARACRDLAASTSPTSTARRRSAGPAVGWSARLAKRLPIVYDFDDAIYLPDRQRRQRLGWAS